MSAKGDLSDSSSNPRCAIDELEGIPKRYHEADLLECDGDIEAVITATEWVFKPSGMLLIYGKCGRGKTWLAAAAKRQFNRGGRECLFVKEQQIFSDIRQSFGENPEMSEHKAYEKYTRGAPLIIDDVGVEKSSEWVLSVWEKIIGQRYDDCSPTMLTSNLNIDELKDYFGVRVAARIREDKKIVEYVGKDWRAE